MHSTYTTLIFDLSEVLIRGFLGVERILTPILRVSEGQLVKAFGGDVLSALCKGDITEDEYLTTVLKTYQWDVPVDDLKRYIRENFEQAVPGMLDLVKELSRSYHLVLLSDHAKEWVEYILEYHQFLDLLSPKIFSFELGSIKSQPETFTKALARINTPSKACLFIDDNLNNIAAAGTVGIKGIHFTHTAAFLSKLHKHNILRAYSLQERA